MKAILLTEDQLNLLCCLCEQAQDADPEIGYAADVAGAYAALENSHDLSSASAYIEHLLQLHRRLPGSQPYGDFTIDHLIYVIARFAVSLHKYPTEECDGRWTTMVGIIKKWLGPQLNVGHGLTKTAPK